MRILTSTHNDTVSTTGPPVPDCWGIARASDLSDNVAYWHKADIHPSTRNVRLWG
jgi:hypothetical protein